MTGYDPQGAALSLSQGEIIVGAFGPGSGFGAGFFLLFLIWRRLAPGASIARAWRRTPLICRHYTALEERVG
jgi:hypothetical protein